VRTIYRIDNFLRILGEQWKDSGSDLRFLQFLYLQGVEPLGDEECYDISDKELIKALFPEVDENLYKNWDPYSEERIDTFLQIIGEQWKKTGPDYRFFQFLFNVGVGPLGDTHCYHIEEHELLKALFPFINEREYMYWGTFGPNRELKFPKFSLIKDLDTDHIKAILETQKHIDKVYKNAFENELRFRGEA